MDLKWLKSIEHGFKRTVFALAQIFLKKGSKDFIGIDATKIKRILLIRPERLGDMIISLPVIHNLKKTYPHLELYLICSPTSIAVMKNDPTITRNYLYVKKPFRDIAMLREIRRLKVDVVIDMICDDSVTALFLSQLIGSKGPRIGVGKRRYQRYYDFNTACRTGRGGKAGFANTAPAGSSDTRHVIDTTTDLLMAFGFNVNEIEKHVPPVVTEANMAKADAFLDTLPGSSQCELIGYNISAGHPSRVWQEEKSRELISRLLEAYPLSYFIISFDPRERARAIRLAGCFNERVTPLPAGMSLLDVAAVIRRLTMLITPDTSLVHIARSFKVPVVAFYTNYGHNFHMWKPYNQDVGAVISQSESNIFDITVDDAYDTARKVLPVGSSI